MSVQVYCEKVQNSLMLLLSRSDNVFRQFVRARDRIFLY